MTFKTTLQLLSALPADLPPRHISGDGNAAELVISALCEDSRKADEKALFVAIVGARSDGHDYLAAAYERGCRCFVVQRTPDLPLPSDADVFCVPDTRRALAYLSAAYYDHPADRMTLVGITGTKGKTTTALMIYRLLARLGVCVGYIGTEGAWYGEHREPTANTTPGPLVLHSMLDRMYQSGVTTVIMEISSQSVMQHRIEGLSFRVGAFTNLSPDHVSPTEHPTFEHYRDCKHAFLRDHIAKDGTLLLHITDPHAAYMAKDIRARIVTFGVDAEADLCAHTPLPTRQNGAPAVSFGCDGEQYVLSMAGEYNVCNALCAVGILQALGYDHRTTLPMMASIRVPGRLEQIDAPEGCAVLIDYAHNGLSLSSVLQTLRPYTAERLICLVGSVGGRSQMRRADLGDAAAQYADLTVLTADNPDFEDPRAISEEMAASFESRGQDNYVIIPDRAEAIRAAVSMLHEGDVLLLAGKGCEDYQLIRGERVPLSEREIVARALRAFLLPL